MSIAIDTNIFVYANGIDTDARRDAAFDLIERLPRDAVVVSIQVLGELFNVLVKKLCWSAADAATVILDWSEAFALAETSAASFFDALELTTVHRLQIWDALILATSARAGCRLLLTEDMHDGFVWNGVTVTNPFATAGRELLNDLFEPG